MTTGIGYTVTRGGLPIVSNDLLGGVKFSATTFSQISNTSSIFTPYNGMGQSIDLGGAKWQGVYSFPKVNLGNDQFGKIKAWKARLRGSAGRFLGRDPSWCNKDLQLNRDIDVSVTVTIPEVPGVSLYPYDGTYPSHSYPTGGYFPEYTFTLRYVQSKITLKVADDTESGTIFSVIASSAPEFTNDNPWLCEHGYHPLYKQYYDNAVSQLEREHKIDINAGLTKSFLNEGDYFQVDDHLLMVVDASDPDALVFEPPLRYPVSKETFINTVDPACVMHLVDDEQVNWSGAGIIAEFGSFTAMETFT